MVLANVSLQYIKYIVTPLLLAKKPDDDGAIMDEMYEMV